jgi:hypothetical protein
MSIDSKDAPPPPPPPPPVDYSASNQPVTEEGQPSPESKLSSAETPETDRLQSLSWDHATKKERPDEGAAALRIEEATGVRLERFQDNSSDFIGSDGKTYDVVGSGLKSEFFDAQFGRLQERIVDHLDKADYVVVDTSQLTPEQAARVNEFVSQHSPRVFTVGDK